MDRKTIRKAFKDIGYKVSFQINPFNCDICNIAFKNDEMLKPAVVSSGSVYGAEFYTAHKPAFDLAGKFKGEFMEDTDQKIV